MVSIAVMEWICGGGLKSRSDSGFEALLDEGFAMLRTVVGGLHRAGYEIRAPIGVSVAERLDIAGLASQVDFMEVSDGQQLERAWQELAKRSDWSIVIAPECDGILVDIIGQLESQSQLINCTDDFLVNTCDKLLTAEKLQGHSVSHPPTIRLAECDQGWLGRNRRYSLGESELPPWIVKPASGAGCDGVLMTDAALSHKARHEADQLIVQPRMCGPAFSRSAIVDTDGTWHWLPLLTQAIELIPILGETNGLNVKHSDVKHSELALKYTGGKLCEPPESAQLDSVLKKVEKALGAGARGWVGVDLVFEPARDLWSVIEINPRLTTSVVGLAAAYSGNLMSELFELCTLSASSRSLSNRWKALEFTTTNA